MTFTYSPASMTDATRVRFHTGDTTEGENFLSDEEITFLLAEESSWRGAVIAGLKFIILKLSKPDFSADWLKVSNAEARKGYQAMLAEKRAEFSIAAIAASSTRVVRDDYATDEDG